MFLHAKSFLYLNCSSLEIPQRAAVATVSSACVALVSRLWRARHDKRKHTLKEAAAVCTEAENCKRRARGVQRQE